MNSYIVMAEIIQDPQLRYTSDNQTPITEMMVQFDPLRESDPPPTLKVVAWGNLAQEVQEHYHRGDRVIIEGRLGMNRIDRPEGFKETRAELTAQRLHKLGADATVRTSTVDMNLTAPSAAPAPVAAATPKPKAAPKAPTVDTPKASPYSSAASEPTDYDDIPF